MEHKDRVKDKARIDSLMSGKKRQQALRERREKLGLKRKEYWLTQPQHTKVKQFIKTFKTTKENNHE